MRDKLDEIEAASEQDHAAAEQALRELKQAQAELEALRAKAERAEKKASLASNEDFVLFHTIFNLIQEYGNKGLGVLLRMRNRDPKQAEGCSKAYLDWLGKMKEAVGQ